MTRSRTGRWLRRGALALGMILAGLLLALWLAMRASLPVLEGQRPVAGLADTATVTRDALGVVTIDAAHERDAMRALGYVHAQERYFEMDLLRRTSAGELSALFGARALELDQSRRIHRLRARAVADLDRLPPQQRAVLEAYTDGINAGLTDLRARPWPYLLIRQTPEPWRPEDTALAGYAMYFDLQDAGNRDELALARMRPHLPPALFALLTHEGSRWDAPLQGDGAGDAPLPGADAVDLRTLPAPQATGTAALPAQRWREPLAAGSNNFAVSGRLTDDGRAIVADDMHLGLRAPNIWFRARLRYADSRAPEGRVDVTGFTLPGVPGVVVGSNGHVAWGFTNSYIDTTDWARVRPCPKNNPRPAGCTAVRVHRERIAVAGGRGRTYEVRETDWGPLMHEEPGGEALALRWTAHLPGSLNYVLLELAHAADVGTALDIAARARMPTQNLLVGDSEGRIAWRWIGGVPDRPARCRQLWTWDADRCAPWGFRAPEATPAAIAGERLWTANSRVVDPKTMAAVGDGRSALGARARQIREALHARDRFDEGELLAIQLDDRAVFLQRWWRLLRDSADGADTPALRALADAAAAWEGRAATGSVSYRIVRGWRLAVHERLAEGLTAPARAALGERFVMPGLPQFEGVVWPLLEQRPMHLLPPKYPSWDALLEDAAADVRGELSEHGPLAGRSWGERNTAAICHPLAAAIPVIGQRALCMPQEPLPGDTHMPRVQGPAMGASERMVVAPGHEADGLAHMPGGQSGHPLSPFWGAGHDDWVRGRPTPFLPGEPHYTLTLTP